jgi:SAM-dependent methyltransferase
MVFDDPVDAAAPLARRLAEQHCCRDPVSGESCAWYHGWRLVLRALGIGRSGVPDAHRLFLDQALRDLAGESSFASVLISGSADYAMPALVLNAYSSRGALPRLTVVDICRTPLLLNNWYADRYGIAVEVCHSDILDYQAEKPGDIVCTHHFFNYFAPGARPSVVAKWRSLLRPGGKLLLVNRYRKLGRPLKSGYSEAEGSAFLSSARAAVRQQLNTFTFSESEIEEMLQTYRAKIRAHTLDSPEELYGLLTTGGFVIEEHTLFSERRGVAGTGANSEETAEAIGVIARRLY